MIIGKVRNITRNRYDLIDDDENKFVEKSLPGFIAHRHSQSVLSILAKKIGCEFLSAYESEWALDENGHRTYKKKWTNQCYSFNLKITFDCSSYQR